MKEIGPDQIRTELRRAADSLDVGSPPPLEQRRHPRHPQLVAAATGGVLIALAAVLATVISSDNHNETIPSAAASDGHSHHVVARISPSAGSDTGGGSPSTQTSTTYSTSSSPAAACTSTDLSGTVVMQQAYSFHYLAVLAVQNVGSQSCTLSGYPAISAIANGAIPSSQPSTTPATASVGRRLAPSKHRTATSGDSLPIAPDYATDSPVYSNVSDDPVVLSPGDSAGLLVGTLRDPNALASCPPAPNTELEISTSQSAAPFDVPVNLGLCDGITVYVSPFQQQPVLPTPG